jgi:3-phosphoshikimate 1-carboxyvinyltransferase
MPDAAMTLAAVACFAEGTTTIRGLRTLRDKETDRVEAPRVELSKIGVDVRVGVEGDADALVITPPRGGIDGAGGERVERVERVDFDTYDDHRMAMALSLIALRRPNTWIRDPACVAKTYPGYWSEIARLQELAGNGG